MRTSAFCGSRRRGRSTSLGTPLFPHLEDPDIAEKVVLLSRTESRYSAESRSLSENVQRGEDAVARFLDRRKEGLRLESAFLCMAPEELAEVERIRRKLDALGGSSADIQGRRTTVRPRLYRVQGDE